MIDVPIRVIQRTIKSSKVQSIHPIQIQGLQGLERYTITIHVVEDVNMYTCIVSRPQTQLGIVTSSSEEERNSS